MNKSKINPETDDDADSSLDSSLESALANAKSPEEYIRIFNKMMPVTAGKANVTFGGVNVRDEEGKLSNLQKMLPELSGRNICRAVGVRGLPPDKDEIIDRICQLLEDFPDTFDDEQREVAELYVIGNNQAEIARAVRKSQPTVSRIFNRILAIVSPGSI